MKKQYVVGFMFSEDRKSVVLIRKNKPEWQAGKLNGVGGKIEPGEIPGDAMMREFIEEAMAIYTAWHHFLTISYKEAVVYFYRAFDDECFQCAETGESEVIEKISLDAWPSDEVIPNLNWIVNLALDEMIDYTKANEVE